MTRLGLMLLVLGPLAWPALVGGAATPVPRALGPILQQAQEHRKNQRAELAIQPLQSYQGDDHALRHLLLGHAWLEQTNWNPAASAYRRALELDATLDEARLGLAHVHARQEQWSEAATVLGQFVKLWTAEADPLLLYGQAALALEDYRLAQVLTETGLSRFPADLRFRRLDLARLIKTGDFLQAKAVVLHLLKTEPVMPRGWEQLASVALQCATPSEQSAALEAALLANPDNLDRHRQFLSSLLLNGDWLTVLEQGQRLLAGRLAGKAEQHPELLELLIRAADEGERDDLLARWLQRVAENQRTKNMRLAEARSALRQGHTDQARAALRILIANGETDASVFLWAGNLAENAGATAEAESHYVHATHRSGPAASLATLYLSRLFHALGRSEEAARVLRQHLDKHPEDAVARALLAAFSQKPNSQ